MESIPFSPASKEEKTMGGLTAMLRGWAGKPSHPPLTDASIGAYTVGVAMLVAGKLGLQTPQMAVGALIAISGGLLLAAPTALTGLLDWLRLPQGSPVRTVATAHLVAMVSATMLFAGTWLAQRPGYNHGDVRGSALVLGLLAEATLTLGGYLGGTIVFVYGTRVLGREDTPVSDALVPAREETETI
jgi:uncharacterized membrane protein